VGQPPPHRAHVLVHVIHPPGGGGRAGHRRVGNDELRDELHPIGAVDLGGRHCQSKSLKPPSAALTSLGLRLIW